jgi:hypothetical protein
MAKSKQNVADEPPVEEARGIKLIRYQIVEPFHVNDGCLMSELSADQFRRRRHNLALVEGDAEAHWPSNVYRATARVAFKVGEAVMLNPADVPKTLHTAAIPAVA